MITFTKETNIPGDIKAGGKSPFFLIAGPCVIESEELLQQTADFLKSIQHKYKIGIFLKSSYDKANRSNIDSFRGPGMEAGLELLKKARGDFGFPVLTDVHTPQEAEAAAEVCDMIQIPAFLCRQTDLILAAAKTGKWVNVKKGQFVAPEDALQIVDKFISAGSDKIFLCERGYTFGYNNLVVDMRSIEILRKAGVKTIIDVTHSTQLPGGGKITGGQREMSFPIGRASAAVGVDGVFMEVHPVPEKAKSDSTTQLNYSDAERLIASMLAIDKVVKNNDTGF
jgi:2-dehydro-3-deoxyphosphooctonate aldolase (KDO 8-P synthase)